MKLELADGGRGTIVRAYERHANYVPSYSRPPKHFHMVRHGVPSSFRRRRTYELPTHRLNDSSLFAFRLNDDLIDPNVHIDPHYVPGPPLPQHPPGFLDQETLGIKNKYWGMGIAAYLLFK